MNRLSNNLNVLGTNGIGKNVSIELNNSITVRGTMSEIIDFNSKKYVNIDHNLNGSGSTICLNDAYITKCEIDGEDSPSVSKVPYSPIIAETFIATSPIVFDLFSDIGGISRFNTSYISLSATKCICLEKYVKYRLQLSLYGIKQGIANCGFNVIYAYDKVRILPKLLNLAIKKSLSYGKLFNESVQTHLSSCTDKELGEIISDGSFISDYRNYALYFLLDRINKRQNGVEIDN